MSTQHYERKLELLRLRAQQKCGKSSFITQALIGNIDEELLDTYLGYVKNRKGEVDFDIIKLIRLLYLGSDSTPGIMEAKKKIVEQLTSFPYWPVNKQVTKDTDKIVFWSENHILMMLGSCYLIRQWELLHVGDSGGIINTRDEEVRKGDLNSNHSPQHHFLQQHHRQQKKVIEELNSKYLESKLLFRYLSAHCSHLFHGFYEVNSHVYLPYTISALLNLYDFAVDANIRQFAHQMVDMAVHQVMLCTTPTNSTFYAASARAFLRTRQRPFNHNINQLINLINSHPSNTTTPDPIDTSTITDFLLTSTWRPDSDDGLHGTMHHPSFNAIDALGYSGFITLPMNHDTALIRKLYQSSTTSLCTGAGIDGEGSPHPTSPPSAAVINIDIAMLPIDDDIPAIELIPFYWSAGLITHPSIVSDTREYQRVKGLSNNKHLWYLSYFSSSGLRHIMDSYELFSMGQVYTGITLNVYKRASEGLCLNSFEHFNPHICGFQQLPWIANIAGIPIWSQSGLGKHNKPSGIAGFTMTNTHNPWVSQRGSLLVSCYKAPKKLVSSTTILRRLFSYETQLFWPEILFSSNHVLPYHKKRMTHKSFAKQQNRISKSRIFSMFHSSSSSTTTTTTATSGIDLIEFKDVSDMNEYNWLIGVKDNCVIAVLCTDKVSILRVDDQSKSSMFNISSSNSGGNDDSYYHLEVRSPCITTSSVHGGVSNAPGDEEVMVPLTRLLCSTDAHCWVVVVDVLSNYGGSIESFYNRRLSLIDIHDSKSVDVSENSADISSSSSTSSGTSSGYKGGISHKAASEFIISVRDAVEGTIDYLVSDDA